MLHLLTAVCACVCFARIHVCSQVPKCALVRVLPVDCMCFHVRPFFNFCTHIWLSVQYLHAVICIGPLIHLTVTIRLCVRMQN